MAKPLAILCFSVAVLAGCASGRVSEPHTVAIVGAVVIHPERDGASVASPDTTIVIRDARIEAVGPAATTSVPAGSLVIDGRGKWVIPGLIDSHVHFFQSGNLYTRPDVADFNRWMPYAKEVARNQARLSATFKVWLGGGGAGVVGGGGPVLDFGGPRRGPRPRPTPGSKGGGPAVLDGGWSRSRPRRPADREDRFGH